MPEVVVVRGESGVLYEMDVPTAGHALERWNEKIAKGELAIVTDPVEWVDDGQGARRLMLPTGPVEAAPVAVEPSEDTSAPDVPDEAPKRRGRPKNAAPVADSDPVEE